MCDRLLNSYKVSNFDFIKNKKGVEDAAEIVIRMNSKAADSISLIEIINEIFLKTLLRDDSMYDDRVELLRDNVSARYFYSMILECRLEGKSSSLIEAEMSFLECYVIIYIECVRNFGLIDDDFYQQITSLVNHS